jgi:ABC-2 type transport system ATP-binding protein
VSAIAVRGLRKAYGKLEAVRGVDFEIEEGEVFGLLGPNGAGKTTIVEILEGYRKRDRARSPSSPRSGAPGREFRSASASCCSSRSFKNVTVREMPDVRGLLRALARRRQVIELVGLEEARHAREDTLRRTETPAGSRHRARRRSRLVFLDGRRPASTRPQRAAWDMIRSLRALGKTVLLTTHYLDEAEQLADRVAVMREGDRPRRHAARATTTDLEVEIRYRRGGETSSRRRSRPACCRN